MALVEQKLVADAVLVAVSGRIDGVLELPAPPPSAQRFVLHLGGVTSISALGVRLFEELLTQLPLPTTLIHVSPAIAIHVNLVPSLSQIAHVQTAWLPFVCGDCEAERRELLPWRHGADRRYAPVCECGATMQLDGLPEHYLPSQDASLELP